MHHFREDYKENSNRDHAETGAFSGEVSGSLGVADNDNTAAISGNVEQ